MKKTAIFAHYDKNAVIEDYVIYYLEGLKKVAEDIIFVSDCDLSEKELEKISSITAHIIAQKHEEYDFGSYKRGFLYALEQGLLDDADECIWANDSCFAPLFSFGEMFDKMESQNVDFWGVTENKIGLEDFNYPHIQSCFIVFRKQVFTDERFIDFVKNITKQPTKHDIISKYEIGLSQYLTSLGCRYSCYIPTYDEVDNSLINKWDEIITKYRCPLAKISLLRQEPLSLKKIINKYTNYPVIFIKIANNIQQLGFYLLEMRRNLIKIQFSKRKLCLLGKWHKF